MICRHCGKETDPDPVFVKFPMLVYKAAKDKDGKTIMDYKRAESEDDLSALKAEGYVEGQDKALAALDAPPVAPEPDAGDGKKKGRHA